MSESRNKPNANGAKAKSNFFHSRVTAGIDLLPTVDGRSVWARIMRDTYRSMIAAAGGDDYISEPRRLLARRVAAFEAELINLEDTFAAQRGAGESPSTYALDLYSRLCGQQRRCLITLGLDRVARDVTPTLHDYIQGKCRLDDVEDLEEAEEADA